MIILDSYMIHILFIYDSYMIHLRRKNDIIIYERIEHFVHCILHT
jgi:hypothetical protein